MNKKRESGMLLLTALIWVAIMALAVLCGSCTTKKVITETEYVHDTLFQSHSDTVEIIKHEIDSVIVYKTINTHDTIFRDRGQVIVLNEQGDTVKTREWDNLYQKLSERIDELNRMNHVEKDSLLKHENDSLRKILKQEHEKKTIKSKPLIQPIDGFFLFLILSAVVCLSVLAYKKK